MLTHRDRRGTPPWPKIGPPLRGRPEKAAGKEGGAGRAGCPDQPPDVAGGLLRATATLAGIGYGP